jgi:hypothetical protein
MSAAPRRRTLLLCALAASAALVVAAVAVAKQAFITSFHNVSRIASAVPTSGPARGDQNPYGVALVPRTVGNLKRGDVLVSNFNDAANHQGTGSSVMEISPSGKAKVFAIVPQPTSTKAVGLTTALGVLPNGYVFVGSLPAPGGTASAARAGAVTILNSKGKVVETLKGGPINGPWDMTIVDRGTDAVLFVTNVLNGTVAAHGNVVNKGTVVRIILRFPAGHPPKVTEEKVIATGFAEKTDPAALVIGPTGVGVGAPGTLYVADSARNRIAMIPNAVNRTTVAQHGGTTLASGGALNDPLGLAIAPNNDVLTVNGADGNIVETSHAGARLATKTLVPNGAGDLFGLAVRFGPGGVYFVNDAGSGAASNSLELLH